MRRVVALVGPLALVACSNPAERVQAERLAERKALAAEVVAGGKTFVEAGCEAVDGEWDADRALCKRSITSKSKSASQEEALAERLDALAVLSSDARPAAAIAQPAADKFLSDHHLDDHRGAVSAAISAVRRDGLLHGVDDERLRQLTAWKIIDGSAIVGRDGTLTVDGKVLIDRKGGVRLSTAR